jgi:serine-type D-Ala-D-Ala carboxypeptidase/endopeptidase
VLSLLDRRSAAWLLGIWLLAGTSADAGPLPERVEKAARERISAGTYQTLVFGVVDGDNGEVVAFGKFDDGKAPDGDTVYEIGSVTKTFTATLLAQAVLSGRVTLDEPVAQLLPDFKIPSRSGMEITLEQLGTQHSALPRMPSNFEPKDPANPYADYDAAKLKAFLAEYQLPRDPNASYEYSNLGFGLLGYALAQLEHATYGAVTGETILTPLGMTMSGTVFSDAMRTHLAAGHDVSGAAAQNWDQDALAGAGAIRSTANDMLRYLKANMGIAPSPLTAAMKLAQQPRSDMTKTMRIGLAWMTTKNGIIWHNGETGGYRSFLGFTADRRHGVVILSNTAADADDLGFATLDAGAAPAPTYQAIVLPRASLDDYVGTYKLADKFLLKIFRIDDGLFAQATGQGPIPIFPSAPNEFFAKLVRASVSFTRDPSGAVDGLVLHQNGDRTAPKLSASELPPELKEIALDAATSADYVGKYQFDFGAVLDVVLKSDHLEARLTGQAAFQIFASQGQVLLQGRRRATRLRTRRERKNCRGGSAPRWARYAGTPHGRTMMILACEPRSDGPPSASAMGHEAAGSRASLGAGDSIFAETMPPHGISAPWVST